MVKATYSDWGVYYTEPPLSYPNYHTIGWYLDPSIKDVFDLSVQELKKKKTSCHRFCFFFKTQPDQSHNKDAQHTDNTHGYNSHTQGTTPPLVKKLASNKKIKN